MKQYKSLKSLIGNALIAKDGEIGKADNFYFDDISWVIRYLVVSTGGFLKGKKVLLSPVAITKIDSELSLIFVDLTMEQVLNSPDIDTKKPIDRQDEVRLFKHYTWPFYWITGLTESDSMLSTTRVPIEPIPYEQEKDASNGKKNYKQENENDPHLRSNSEVIGYGIHANDGDIGHVEDLIVDDSNWKIQYFLINTRSWLPGKRILISPQWVKDISWLEEKVFVDLSQEIIQLGPEYDFSRPISSDYEMRLHSYYQKHFSQNSQQTQEVQQPQQKHQESTFNSNLDKDIDLDLDLDLKKCIDDCILCNNKCKSTLIYCTGKGGQHIERNHILGLIECAEICSASSIFMLTNNQKWKELCSICEDICMKCALSCEEFKDDQEMQKCAEACRKCSTSCKEMKSITV
ncbi:MAG: four-helix bundle copper-binding protein [Oligoflexia bacterium]|nr:four-helix bundle copper-binding protein [Oligoflexia bacterium]